MDEGNLKKILGRLGITNSVRQGKWLQFSCPYAPWTHKKGTDNNPSCGALINEQGVSSYKCFSCKKHGRISSLVRSLEHYRDKDYGQLALEADLADTEMSFGDFEGQEEELDELPPPLNEAVYLNMYEPAWAVSEARAYLKSRNVSKQTADYLQLGYDPDEYRIVFPVRHTDNKLYGFTGRSILDEKDYPYKKYKKVRDYEGLPKRHLLMGAELVIDGLPLFVHEGLFGHAHLYEIGADEIVNPLAMLGSELTASKADIIRGFDRLTAMVADNDEAGDACLFGTWDAKAQDFSGGGAVDLLYQHVPIIVPKWPETESGDEKTDVEELTLDDVRRMVNDTPLWGAKKSFKKKGGGMTK